MAYAICKLHQEYTIGSIEHAKVIRSEVLAMAKWCKAHGYTGKTGDPLPDLASSRACTWIANNPYAFRLMVREA